MKLRVEVSPPYPVYVESGVLERAASLIHEPEVAVFSDRLVAGHYLEPFKTVLERAGKRVVTFTFAPGEGSKTVACLAEALEQLAASGLDRQSAVIALGGGVTGDLAGFVAASYLRGVAFYQCPTSLLAMVDASIGGKTGVNLDHGKNLAGAFWQPRAVLADIATLRSLPLRVFKQGAVELFKHGLLKDESILNDVTSAQFQPEGNASFLEDLIGRSIQVKADIVAADEREQGLRAHLNLGHTLAHALEAASHHRLSHGDAVGYGLLFAAQLAKARGFDDETERILAFLRWLEPEPLGIQDFEALEPYLQQDKKRQGETLRFVLLKSTGTPVIVDDISRAELLNAWRYLQEVSRDPSSQRT